MLIRLAALAAVLAWPSGTRWRSVQAWPDSWGDSPATSLASPAGLSRLEGPAVEGWWGETDAGDRWSLAAGLPCGRWSFGTAGGGGTGSESPDSVFAGVSAARVLTGDPRGFIRGFFGPSICIGASLEFNTAPGGEGASLSACSHVQFSVFPTFAVGASLSRVGLFGKGNDSPVFGYGGTYIFNRQLRGHAGYRDHDVSAGAELCVGDRLVFSAGTEGRSWSAGLRALLGRLEAGYSVTLCDSAAFHGLSVSFYPGTGTEEW